MPETRRIAVIGGGPKGLYALDALCEAYRARPALAGAVTLYEPATPGPGPVYDPAQPDFLLMNFTSDRIDAFSRRSGAPDRARPDFCAWARAWTPEHAAPDGYAPRAVVGRYLAMAFEVVCRQRPANLRIAHRPVRVDRLEPGRDGWTVAGETCDEVLVATGHQDWQGGARVFPVARQLSEDRVPPGAEVRIKGFGLTAIDAVLALTLGRGGRFEGDGYRPSGREPSRIHVTSRTFRPMMAKPGEGIAWPGDHARAVEELERVFSAPGPVVDAGAEIQDPLCAAADALLARPSGSASEWFAAWRATRPDRAEVQGLLRRSFREATGDAPPGIAAALGVLWRGAYPALVDRVARDGIAAAAMAEFTALAAEMERIAFGPPPLNLGRMATLMEHGLLYAGRDVPTAPDAPVIDATLPPPAARDPAGPLAALERAGLLRLTAAGTVAVTPAARALSPAGGTVPGLSVIGRATEWSVLGNDTLSRRMHDTPEAWAASVLAAQAGGLADRRLSA